MWYRYFSLYFTTYMMLVMAGRPSHIRHFFGIRKMETRVRFFVSAAGEHEPVNSAHFGQNALLIATERHVSAVVWSD